MIFNDVLPNESGRQHWTTQPETVGYAKCHFNYPSLFAPNAEVNICTILCPLDPSMPSFVVFLFIISAKWLNIPLFSNRVWLLVLGCPCLKPGSIIGFNTYILKSILLTEWQDTDFCLSINPMIHLIPLYHRPLSKISLISPLANKFNVEIQTNNE